MSETVANCDNPQWTVNYSSVSSDKDPLAQDIMYHKQYMTEQWRKYVQKPSQKRKLAESSAGNEYEGAIEFIAAEIEFFADIQQIQEGSIIPINQAQQDYESKMKEHGINYVSKYTHQNNERKMLKEKIQRNVKDVKFLSPTGRNKPTLILSDATQHSKLEDVFSKRDIQADMQTLLKASLIARKAISVAKKKPWIFEGSLENCGNAGVPQELLNMSRWIIQGVNSAKTSSWQEAMTRSAGVISQQIMQAHKSTRQVKYEPTSTDTNAISFRSTIETPITLGMSQYCQNAFRNHKLTQLLAGAGVGVPYKRVKKCVSQISNGVRKNMEQHDGIYIPTGLHNQCQLRFSIDNIDANVDTPDGRNSFHATAMAVYQKGFSLPVFFKKGWLNQQSHWIPQQFSVKKMSQVLLSPFFTPISLEVQNHQLVHIIIISNWGRTKMNYFKQNLWT